MATMTTSPQLPNHLIRELLHIIRRKDDGDGMVLLALSGKETFPVFKYVVETSLEVVLEDSDIIISSDPNMNHFVFCPLEFSTEGSRRLFNRFVRKLYAYENPLKPLHYDAITELMIYDDNITNYTSILASWDNVETLKITMNIFLEVFLNKVRTGVLLLTNLRTLAMRMMFDELFKPMKTNPHFPYPENVSLELTVDKNAVPYSGPLSTFTKVKHLELIIELKRQIAPEVYRQVATFINRFPSLETTQVYFTFLHKPCPEDVSVITNFHGGLRITDFNTPVEMNFDEYVKIDGADKPVTFISEQWKSYGFEEDGDESKFIIKKEYGNVKLVHRIEHLKPARF